MAERLKAMKKTLQALKGRMWASSDKLAHRVVLSSFWSLHRENLASSDRSEAHLGG